ncbi:MAG: transpeptidase family protein [Bacteroidetes bacterium]|nr:transpeptidase family protein [Bacteroidota bacterium]
MEINKELSARYLLVWILITIFGIAIVVRVLSLQFFSAEGSALREKQQQKSTKLKEPARGIIYSRDGKELAIAVPIYKVALDYRAIEKDSTFENNKHALADSLARMFGKPKSHYLQLLEKAKKTNNIAYLHTNYVDYDIYNRMIKFPILKHGKNKGGLNVEEKFKRDYPYNNIARRTIGNFIISDGKPVSEYGLELHFDKELRGKAVEIDTLVNADKQKQPTNGYDIITNLDVGIQSITHEELLKALREKKAEWGCAIVMETKTGAILAMTNLARAEKDTSYTKYSEAVRNFAVEERRDPGSTIKLPSLIIALADGAITLDDTIRVKTDGNGHATYYNKGVRTQVRDWDWFIKGYYNKKMTVRDGFAYSSNLIISKVIYDNYVSHQKSEDYYNRMKLMGLYNKTGIDLPKEANPDIKDFANWDGGTLIQMSYGYELSLTPLQILTFYNAVANNGKMMKPYLVREIKNGSEVVRKIKPEVLNASICNKKTLDLAKELLLSVVETPKIGTAKEIKNDNYRIAGKTGSAQTYNENTGGFDGNIRGSFCGYFPADAPKYTCIVVIQGAPKGLPVGGGVVAKIFKKISDRIYYSDHELRNQMNVDAGKFVKIPDSYNGYERDFTGIFKLLNLPQAQTITRGEWVQTAVEENKMYYTAVNVVDRSEKITPNLKGMGMRDAVYLAENAGLRVKCVGYGKVVTQSIVAGTPTKNYSEITLEFR